MTETQQPTRKEFVEFWKKENKDTSSWRGLVPYGIYISGLTLYAVIVRLIDDTGRFWFISLAIAIAYIVIVPYIWIHNAWKRHGKFIRCPQCGDWIGRDSSSAWFGPNPKWITISQTGKCGNCGKQLLVEE